MSFCSICLGKVQSGRLPSEIEIYKYSFKTDAVINKIKAVCSHSFCENCLLKWSRFISTPTCPLCRKSFETLSPSDMKTESVFKIKLNDVDILTFFNIIKNFMQKDDFATLGKIKKNHIDLFELSVIFRYFFQEYFHCNNLEKAKKIANLIEHPIIQLKAYLDLAEKYVSKDQLKNAVDCISIVFEINKRIDDREMQKDILLAIGFILSDIAKSYLRLRSLEEAAQIIIKIEKIKILLPSAFNGDMFFFTINFILGNLVIKYFHAKDMHKAKCCAMMIENMNLRKKALYYLGKNIYAE